MEDIKWRFKKYGVGFVILFIIIVFAGVMLGPQVKNKENVDLKSTEESYDKLEKYDELEKSEIEKAAEEKGYDLPIEPEEFAEAKEDCMALLECIKTIYEKADKGSSLNVVLSQETLIEMLEKLKGTGYPFVVPTLYMNMENFQKMKQFIEMAKQQKKSEIVLYELNSDGGIRRQKFTYDGKNMYVFFMRAAWNEEDEPLVISDSFSRIKKWEYTEKGWFHYELCVPEYPEVSEVVLADVLVRIKPLAEEYRVFSMNAILPIAYQGNNLLCSNWDQNHMEELDYNALYESFYFMKYKKRFDGTQYQNGIPKQEFEQLIMAYLPVEEKQLEEWAVYNEENETYAWTRLGCSNYSLNAFWESTPEITNMQQNEDGTITVTIDAVCERLGTDCYITHKLTVKQTESGIYQYLGNEIMQGGLELIPSYTYRLGNK